MPTPNKGETEKEFIGRCIPYMMNENPDMKQDQAVAICYSYWEKEKKTEGIVKKIGNLLK